LLLPNGSQILLDFCKQGGLKLLESKQSLHVTLEFFQRVFTLFLAIV